MSGLTTVAHRCTCACGAYHIAGCTLFCQRIAVLPWVASLWTGINSHPLIVLDSPGSTAFGAGCKSRSVASLTARCALNALPKGGVWVVSLGTGAEAGVVEVEVVDGAVGVGTVLSNDGASDAGGAAGLAEVGDGSWYKLAIRTGSPADIGSYLFVVYGWGVVVALRAWTQTWCGTKLTTRCALITGECIAISKVVIRAVE